MANKKYTDFPAGSYDTSKIFLQADATTGALEKVNLPATATYTGTAGSITLTGSAFSIAVTYPGQTSITTLGTIANGTWNASTIAPTKGGTGLTSYTIGDILYASASNTLSKLAIGSTDQVLTIIGGVPTWQSSASTTGFLKQDGSLPLTADWNATAFSIESKQTASTASAVNYGFKLTNTTAATSGTVQHSPAILFEGQSWKSVVPTGTASIRYRAYVFAGTPSSGGNGNFVIEASSSGAAFANVLTLSPAGVLTTPAGIALGIQGITCGGITCSQLINQSAGNGATIFEKQALNNVTAASSIIPQQYSSASSFQAAAWSGSASQSAHFRNYLLPINGTNPITSKLIWQAQINGTGYSDVMTITNSGQLSIGTTSPDASAKLDITSTTQGLLLPRLTTTQKNAISSPATGLLIFDTTLSKMCIRTGSGWETVTSV